MENILDLIRKDKIVTSGKIIKILLSGLDILKNILERVKKGEEEISDTEMFDQVVNETENIANEIEQETVKIFDLIKSKIEKIRNVTHQENMGDIDELFSLISRIENTKKSPKNTTEFPDQIKIIQDILKEPIKIKLDDEKANIIITALNDLKSLSGSKETEKIILTALDERETFLKTVGFDSLVRDMVLEKTEALKSAAWKHKENPEKERKETAKTGTSNEIPEEKNKTMRISEKRIDAFLSYVGELIIIEEMFSCLQKKMVDNSKNNSINQEFKRTIETFSSLSDNLRSSILAIRRIPFRILVQKIPRIVHEIAKASGKEINLETTGEEINIDKSYIDLLDAPIIHMIRNAVDHGIETPEERKAQGKPEKGNIRICLKETENNLQLQISDDGKGIDFDVLKKKAIELGVITPSQKLNEEAIINLIFIAGLSTAKEVTEISGRGVGMDVVKKNIDSAFGKISIESIPKKGTTFMITLPNNVSTQIMEGFLIKVSQDIFVLPMNQIGETFSPLVSDITSIAEKNQVVLRRGQIIPVIDLKKILKRNKTNTIENNKQTIMVSVDINGKRYALSVSEIVGVQKVVVKPVSGLKTDSKLFDGAAMMGDGSVSMIIGNEGLKHLVSFYE